jgi:hypothetical protein
MDNGAWPFFHDPFAVDTGLYGERTSETLYDRGDGLREVFIFGGDEDFVCPKSACDECDVCGDAFVAFETMSMAEDGDHARFTRKICMVYMRGFFFFSMSWSTCRSMVLGRAVVFFVGTFPFAEMRSTWVSTASGGSQELRVHVFVVSGLGGVLRWSSAMSVSVYSRTGCGRGSVVCSSAGVVAAWGGRSFRFRMFHFGRGFPPAVYGGWMVLPVC